MTKISAFENYAKLSFFSFYILSSNLIQMCVLSVFIAYKIYCLRRTRKIFQLKLSLREIIYAYSEYKRTASLSIELRQDRQIFFFHVFNKHSLIYFILKSLQDLDEIIVKKRKRQHFFSQ